MIDKLQLIRFIRNYNGTFSSFKDLELKFNSSELNINNFLEKSLKKEAIEKLSVNTKPEFFIYDILDDIDCSSDLLHIDLYHNMNIERNEPFKYKGINIKYFISEIELVVSINKQYCVSHQLVNSIFLYESNDFEFKWNLDFSKNIKTHIFPKLLDMIPEIISLYEDDNENMANRFKEQLPEEISQLLLFS